MAGCMQLALDFLCSLRHWGQDPEAEPLLSPPDRNFPPPDTILHAPRPRPKPLTGTARSSSASLNPLSGITQSPTNARASLERLRRNDSISQTFAGRMRPLRNSQPPTPTTAQSRQFGSTSKKPTSSASTPLPRMSMPLPFFSPINNIGAQTVPLPTPVPTSDPPTLPPFPMARSVSEPHGMNLDFGAHQLGRGRSTSIVVQRGRRTTRPRAATSVNLVEGRGVTLAITPMDLGAGGRRGRSPGPRSAGLGSGRPSVSRWGSGSGQLNNSRSISNELVITAPDVPVDVDQESTEGESAVPTEEEGVVRRDLGLREGWPSRRGRGRGRPGRGRAITH